MYTEQKPNDRRKIQGIARRLKKERAELDKLAEKYGTCDPMQGLEEYAYWVEDALEHTQSKFQNFKTANKAARRG